MHACIVSDPTCLISLPSMLRCFFCFFIFTLLSTATAASSVDSGERSSFGVVILFRARYAAESSSGLMS